MSPGSTQYTLVGFTAELDWRPLRFVKPIPQNRVCGACGLVRKRTALLPCRHVLCESCYELSTQDGGRVCPLDRQHCEEEDVDLKEFPAEDLLKREVRCWNDGSECRAVLPASEIGRHFERECRCHTICCPKCSRRVLCADVCAHLMTPGCSAAATPAGSGREADSGLEDSTALLLTSFREILEEQACKIQAVLERLLAGGGSYSDRLNDIDHRVNSCQEALREELRQGISGVKDIVRQEEGQVRAEHRDGAKRYSDVMTALNEETKRAVTEELRQGISGVMDIVKQEMGQGRTEHRDGVKKCSDEIAALNEQTNRHFTTGGAAVEVLSNRVHALESLLRDEFAKVATVKQSKGSQFPDGPEGKVEQVQESKNAVGRMTELEAAALQGPRCEFIVHGVNALRAKALKEGRALFNAGRVYLRGYYMFPGIEFSNLSRRVVLRARLLLDKLVTYDFVVWPLVKAVRLCFVHPKGGPERGCVENASYIWPAGGIPREGCIEQPFNFSIICALDDLIRDGYVEDDQLRVTFELLS